MTSTYPFVSRDTGTERFQRNLRSTIRKVQLSESDSRRAGEFARELSAAYPSGPSGAEFLDASASLRERVSFGELGTALDRLRAGTGPSAVLVRGFPVDLDAVGETPLRWGAGRPPESFDFWLQFVSSWFGRPFSWSSLQNGHVIGDVLPVDGRETEQTGLGSVVLLPHVEDAFHPRRCEFLAVSCIRNPGRVATTVIDAAALETLPPEVLRVLAEPRFTIAVDPEHLRGMSGSGDVVDQVPAPAVLLDAEGRPVELRVDEAFMLPRAGDEEAAQALRRLAGVLRVLACPVPLRPGDVLVLDNHRCAHGRGRIPRTRVAGERRWLRRVMLTTDMSSPSVVDPLAAFAQNAY